MADPSPTTNYQQSEEKTLNILAYMFAGLAMMLNIRLSYSAAPYALLRFKLPENLFSVFVRTTSSALELWCLPSMLLGNIMEQAYNHTQDTAMVIHATGLKNSDLKSKASTLKSTSDGQSTSELTASRNTDLNAGGNAQTGLETKADQLRGKAQELSEKANTIVSAAKPGSPLNQLLSDATRLKTAAKDSSDNSLFEKAEALRAKGTGGDARTQATKVIEAFDNVETKYKALMDAAEQNKLTNDPKVIAVDKAYHVVRNTYYQMLIVHRIKQKAIAFHSAVQALKQAAQAQQAQPSTPLGKLHNAAESQMDNLEKEAFNLKDINQGTGDFLIVTYYLNVETAYGKLTEMEAFTEAVKAQESKSIVEPVTTAFDALKKSYENVLKLSVQELSNRSQTLSSKAQTLASDSGLGLKQEANALRNAASNQESGSEGLKEKATKLVEAINSASGDTNAEATKVIDQFEAVRKAYGALTGQTNYATHKADGRVTAVVKAYKDLKNVYDKILKFAKLAKKADALHTAATGSGNTVNPTDVITNFNAVVDAYNALDKNDQKHVEPQFTEVQTEYSNGIYFYKKCIITIPSMFTNWLNFLTFVILFIVYVSGGDQGSVTGYYWIMAISGFVFGINMVLVYAVDYRYLPYYIAGENSFPIVTSAILYFATSIFGNRRKYNSDYLVVLIDISISIFIALVASVLWTIAFVNYRSPMASPDSPKKEVISPALLVLVGMGLVYSIYPGIAPGMIVPFYLIDKIEMVLLILTTFPPLIFAFTTKYAPNWSPKTSFVWHGSFANPKTGFGGWKSYASEHNWGPGECSTETEDVHGWIWHLFDILAPLQIILAVIFIYSIHYRDSNISRSIVNQPKMSTFLTIIFYMCHEIMLATGFPGLVCNGGVTHVLLPTQWVGALLMVLLAFYSIGYITEYKRHDPSSWPTEGMTKWNALCYWLKMASKITNKNFKQLFTTDLRRDLLLCIQKNELI